MGTIDHSFLFFFYVPTGQAYDRHCEETIVSWSSKCWGTSVSWIDNRTVPIIISWLLSPARTLFSLSKCVITWKRKGRAAVIRFVKRWTNSRSLRTSRSLLFSLLFSLKWKRKKNYVNVIDCWSLVCNERNQCWHLEACLKTQLLLPTWFSFFFTN